MTSTRLNHPQISRKWGEAIEAILDSPGVAEAARVRRMSEQTLRRWMKNPVFEAALRAAKRARLQHAMARQRLGANEAARSVLHIMYRGKKQRDRLHAALAVQSLAQQAGEIEDLQAQVSELHRAAVPGKGKDPGVSRGNEKAIAALLQHHSVAAAARAMPAGTQTLHRLMKDPVFLGRFAAAVREVWGPAMTLLQARVEDAVVVIEYLSRGKEVQESTHMRASMHILQEAKTHVTGELRAEVAKLEAGAGLGEGEPQPRSKTIGRQLYERVQRLKEHLSQNAARGRLRLVLVHARDGRPAGSSQEGADGRQVWKDPPEGFRKGDPVPRIPVSYPESA